MNDRNAVIGEGVQTISEQGTEGVCADCDQGARLLSVGWCHLSLRDSMHCPGGKGPGEVNIQDSDIQPDPYIGTMAAEHVQEFERPAPVPCPGGCGCRLGTDDADRFECGCDEGCCE